MGDTRVFCEVAVAIGLLATRARDTVKQLLI